MADRQKERKKKEQESAEAFQRTKKQFGLFGVGTNICNDFSALQLPISFLRLRCENHVLFFLSQLLPTVHISSELKQAYSQRCGLCGAPKFVNYVQYIICFPRYVEACQWFH